MITIYSVAAFWFLSALISTIIANKFFLPDHLLEEPVLDDQMPDIIKERKK
jgi:hypothetical protein